MVSSGSDIVLVVVGPPGHLAEGAGAHVAHEPLGDLGERLAERAATIRLPDRMDDVEVLIVVQGGAVPGDAPRRHDVRYEELDSRGVTKSRNAVLDGARGQFVLFADDDIVFHEEGVRSVLRELVEHPDVALVLGIAVDEGGRLRKPYPSRRSMIS